jgi:hypothetical protein
MRYVQSVAKSYHPNPWPRSGGAFLCGSRDVLLIAISP